MKKLNRLHMKLWMLIILFFAGSNLIQAQNEMEVEGNDSIDEDTEIVVTDNNGEEEIIDLPEAMTYELDSLLLLYNTQTYLQIDSTCNMRNENPEYEKEEYIDRLKRMPTVMEMSYNEVVRKFIDRYSGRLRRSVSYMLGASNFYMPIFEEALETYNVPLELKYLPVIESALNPKAVSRVGATGLWQFMLTTGKQYGLTVNSLVDERRDPIKSSYAAAHYLSDLYRIFGDWNLVIAAYNCGPGNITKAIHRANGEKDYWKIYPYLPQETRGYVPAFIAANYIMNYYCEHNICPMITNLPSKTDTIVVNRDVHFQQIAYVTGMEVEQIKALNPQYRRNIVNGHSGPSTIRLPLAAINAFIDNEEAAYAYNANELLSKRDEVDINDDVPTYTRYRSTYKKKTGRKGRSARGRNSRSNRGGRNVTVRKGDTLSQIAARNHTTVSKLKKMNGIKGNNIQAGKKLKVR